MTLQLTVSPDFSPDFIAGWYVFNTWLQRRLGTRIHLELYDDFVTQRQAIAEDRVDVIYANPHDAAMLVREKGYTALAAPRNKPDEVVVAVHADAAAQHVEDLKPGLKIASPIISPRKYIFSYAANFLFNSSSGSKRCREILFINLPSDL